ncbi:MAG: MFS transporter [Paracoccaceae bacterium]
MDQLRAILKTSSLRRLLLSQIPADFADWLDFVAIGSLLAFSWNAGPMAFAFLAVSVGLPYVLVGPVAGAIVDRSAIRTVLIASNLGRAIATACLFFAPSLPVLLFIVLLRSSADAFYGPAKQAALQAVAEPRLLMAANGMSHGINQASKIAAPALGGLLLLSIEPGSVFLINACISLSAALVLIGFPDIPRKIPLDEKKLPILASVRVGLAEVVGKASLRGALSVMAFGFFAMFFYDTLIAPLIRDLGHVQTVFAGAIAAVGAGGVIGALWLGLGPDRKRPFLWIAVGSAISAAMVVGLGTSAIGDVALPAAGIYGIFAILGFATAVVVVPVRTIVQRDTPPDKIARVSAVSEAANTVALLSAPFLGAGLATMLSIGTAFIVGGVLLFAIAVYAISLGRGYDDQE